MIQAAIASIPAPPSFSGIVTPNKPNSPTSRRRSLFMYPVVDSGGWWWLVVLVVVVVVGGGCDFWGAEYEKSSRFKTKTQFPPTIKTATIKTTKHLFVTTQQLALDSKVGHYYHHHHQQQQNLTFLVGLSSLRANLFDSKVSTHIHTTHHHHHYHHQQQNLTFLVELSSLRGNLFDSKVSTHIPESLVFLSGVEDLITQ